MTLGAMTQGAMTPGQRCDEIIRLIDEVLGTGCDDRRQQSGGHGFGAECLVGARSERAPSFS